MISPQREASKAALEFAAAVKRSRERQALNQTQLAEAAGLTPAAISQIESGLREPTFSTIVRLSTALKTSPNELMGIDVKTEGDPVLKTLFRDLKRLSLDDYDKVKAFATWLATQGK